MQPPAELTRRWQELERLCAGIPVNYDVIINDIDHLTPFLIAQPAFMIPLQQKMNTNPGTIGQVVDALEKVEREIERAVARAEAEEDTVSGMEPILATEPRPEPATLRVEKDFAIR